MVLNKTLNLGDKVICINNKYQVDLNVGEIYYVDSIREVFEELVYYIVPVERMDESFLSSFNTNGLFIERARFALWHFTPVSMLDDKDIFKLKIAGKI